MSLFGNVCVFISSLTLGMYLEKFIQKISMSRSVFTWNKYYDLLEKQKKIDLRIKKMEDDLIKYKKQIYTSEYAVPLIK